uniref:Peptidase S1 domain-containing protein n=1 Tax=Strongyloides venezuelensis TaxID=75913 RepID=A0A0K0F1A8_STRVS
MKSVKKSGNSYGFETLVDSGIPWMARIVNHNRTTVCNGILVTQLHVLTNFGCLEGMEKLIEQQSDYNHLYDRYQVRIGEQSSKDVCDYNSDVLLNCSSKVLVRYINVLHLRHPAMPNDLKYGVIELNRPVTSIPHACIYQYQMDFLGLEERRKVENVFSFMWGVNYDKTFNNFELNVYYYKETFDFKNKRFANSFGCKIREDYTMVIEELENGRWKSILKGAPLLRKIKDNQFGVYGIGEDTCVKKFNNDIKHIQELFFVTFKSAQYFLFDSLNEINHDEEHVGNEFHDISKFYDNRTCGMIRKRDNLSYKSDFFENEAYYPWILSIVKGDHACMGTLISKMHVITSYECVYNTLKVEGKRKFEDHLKGVIVTQSKKYCTFWTSNGNIKIFGNDSAYNCINFDIQYREAFQIFNTASTNYKNLSVILVLKEPFQDVPHVCLNDIFNPSNYTEVSKKYLVHYDTTLSDDNDEIVYLAQYTLTKVSEKELGFNNPEISVTNHNFKYICGRSTGSSIFFKSIQGKHYLYQIQKGFGVCYDKTKSFYYNEEYDFIKSVFKRLPMIKYDTSPFVYNLKKLQYYDYENCGRSSINLEVIYEFLISGGYDINDNRAIPWAVQIRTKTLSCSGVLVSQRHVITAAHCILNTDESSFWYHDKKIVYDTEIVIGNYCNENKDVDGECINKGKVQIRGINRLLYNFKNGYRKQRNDIVVIELDVPIIGVTHICLPFLHDKYKFDKRKTLITFGYGTTKRGRGVINAKFHNRLKRFIYSNPDSVRNCTPPFAPINSTEYLCTDVNVHLGVCPGDSGGGLMQKTFNNRYILIGVNSRTVSCIYMELTDLNFEKPNIFVQVEEYKDEILNFMHETKSYYSENS